ncbi:MAG: DUF5606 domain-containing protein [Bacteroidia bacterium]|nr:DUF5606 domain-containing protein [Bacteroidia bacterium]
MELKDVVAIAGQSGLHKIVGRSKNGLIVETIGTGRRFSTSFQDKVSVLEDISIYTQEEDMRLHLVFIKLKENGNAPSPKDDMKSLRAYLIDLISLDSERVYDNDIKKLLTWFHLLKDVLDFEKLKNAGEESDASEGDEAPAAEASTEAPAEEVKPKKAAAKKTAAPKTATPKSTAAPKANTKGAGASKTSYRPKAV